MVIGLIKKFNGLGAKNQDFGPKLKVFGVVILIPILAILFILTNFKVEVFSGLFGTIVGYVLSNTGDKTHTGDH